MYRLLMWTTVMCLIRSLDAYWEYAQIDVKERKANSAEKFCNKHFKKLEEMPAEASPQLPASPSRKSLRARIGISGVGPSR